MQFSHSRLECYKSCPYKYRLRYLDRVKTLPSDKPDDPLILGSALHKGIEAGVEAGVAQYFASYPVITDAHVNEQIKLEHWIPIVRAMFPGGQSEVMVSDADFLGFIDLVVPARGFHGAEMPGLCDLYDFKYTSNARRYADSEQLHLYRYFFERLNPGKRVRSLGYVIIPKVSPKPRPGEAVRDYRQRLRSELSRKKVEILNVEYDPEYVVDFFRGVKGALEEKEYPKNPGYLCNWCEYQDFCQKGVDYMLLPNNERRELNAVNKRVVWLYGAPFTGKTTFANAFPDPLMLNTDGNIKFVDAPYIPIRDDVRMEGRMTKRTLAWEVFKEAVAELEKKQNSFRTIVVDLLEDLYEHCRLYMYDQMGITHESDDSFRAWDRVRTEFLSTMKRLMNLDYENIILISHEDSTKDITRKGGDKLTSIKPNIQDKVANKVAGMVDIVARIVADGEERTMSFKSNEVIFGGGRLQVRVKEIPLDYEAFASVYAEANKNAGAALKHPASAPERPLTPSEPPVEETPAPAPVSGDAPDPGPTPPPDTEPKPRQRKRRGE
jgi:phage nucleotide-binding protein